MIQHPGPGEILIDIPGAGTLLSRQGYLRESFDGMLAAGTETRRDGMRCITWDVGEARRLDPSDPRHGAAVERLRSLAARSRDASRAMASLLRSSAGAQRVALGPDVLLLMGRDASSVEMARRDVEQLADTHRLAADAVEHAIEHGALWLDDSGVRLSGWGFLPARRVDRPVAVPAPPPPAAPRQEPAAAPERPLVAPGPEPLAPPVPVAEPGPPARTSRRWLPWALLLLLALLLFALVWLLWFLFPGATVSARVPPVLVSPNLPQVLDGGELQRAAPERGAPVQPAVEVPAVGTARSGTEVPVAVEPPVRAAPVEPVTPPGTTVPVTVPARRRLSVFEVPPPSTRRSP